MDNCRWNTTRLNFQDKIPGIIFLVIFSITGLFGNLYTLIIYYKSFKTSVHRINVIALSLVDLCVCVTLIPYDVINMEYNIRFNHPSLHRISVYFDLTASLASLSLLTVISVERHRQVCRPLGHQLTLNQGKCLCCVCIFACAVLLLPGIRLMFIHGCIESVFPNILETKLYVGFLSIIFVCMMITCLTSYARLISKLKRKQEETRSLFLNRRVSVSKTLSTDITTDKTSSLGRQRVYKQYKRSMEKTTVFLVATCLSYGGCLVSTAIISCVTVGIDVIAVFGASFVILFHMMYLNHVINPIVYIIIDSKFRRKFKIMNTYYFKHITKSLNKRHVNQDFHNAN